jgi:hypothetical protein
MNVVGPFLEEHVWGTLAPQGDLRSKSYMNKKFLEFNFREGQFYAKNQKISKTPKFGGPLGPQDGLRLKSFRT